MDGRWGCGARGGPRRWRMRAVAPACRGAGPRRQCRPRGSAGPGRQCRPRGSAGPGRRPVAPHHRPRGCASPWHRRPRGAPPADVENRRHFPRISWRRGTRRGKVVRVYTSTPSENGQTCKEGGVFHDRAPRRRDSRQLVRRRRHAPGPAAAAPGRPAGRRGKPTPLPTYQLAARDQAWKSGTGLHLHPLGKRPNM